MNNKNSKKWYGRWYLWIFIILLVIVIFLPNLLSTTFGTRLLLKIAEKSTNQNIKIDKLSLSWFGPQKADRLVICDKKRHMIFFCAYAETGAPLFKLSQLGANIQLHEGELKITPPGINPIILQEIEVHVDIPKKGYPIQFIATGKTEQQGVSGNFDVKGKIHDFDAKSLQGDLQADIKNFPIIGIDQILEQKGLLIASIGQYIDFKINAVFVKNNVQCDLNVQSPELSAEFSAFSKNNELRLKNPGTFSLNVHSALVKQLTGLEMNQETALINGVIHSLTCPFSEGGLSLQKLSLTADVESTAIAIEDFTISGLKASIKSPAIGVKTDVQIHLSSPQFEIGTLLFTITDQLELTHPLQISYPSTTLNKWLISIESLSLPISLEIEKLKMHSLIERPSWDLHSSITVNTWDAIDLSVQAKNFATHVEGKIEQYTFFVKKPFTITAHLVGDEINTLFPNVTLAKAFDAKIDMQPLSIPIKNLDETHLQCQGKAYADSIALAAKQGGRQFVLDQPVLQFSIDGKNEKAEAALTFNIAEGKLQTNFQITSFRLEDTSEALLIASGSIYNLTPAFFDTLMGEDRTLRTFLGSSLSLNFKIHSSPKLQTLLLKAKSPNLNFSGNFILKDNILQLDSSGLDLNFTLTKESYAWLDAGPFKLQSPALGYLKLQKLQWPLIAKPETTLPLADRFPNLTWDWNQIKLQGNFLLKQVDFDQFALNQTEAHFIKNNELGIDLSCTLSPQGQLHLTMHMPTSEPSQMLMNSQMKEFPTLIFDLFARLLGQKDLSFLPVFGKTLNADFQVNMKNNQGPLSLQITSANTRAALRGEIRDGYLTLNEPLHAQVLMTPELSALLLKEVNPLSIKEITSTSPITLEINSSGFLFPLNPFDPSKLFMSQAKLELGKLACRNEGSLNTTLSLLKWTKIGKGDTLKLWFAPLEFSIKQGIISIDRTEILVADALEIAIFGDLDLSKEYVDMVLGLTPSALKSAFGIKDLPHNYLLQIPMRGPMDKVSIDTASATAKIALLLAWQQRVLGGTIAGGPAGAILGGIAKKAIPLPDMNANVPPAKHPFPWEQPQKQKSSSKPIKKGDKPLKQIIKIFR